MSHSVRQQAYRLWAPIYDGLFGPALERARRRSLALLALQQGERVVVPGVGTGLDLPMLPAGVEAVGLDLSPQMLGRARRKRSPASVELREGDAQALPFPEASFDAAVLHLLVSVVPDGGRAFAEAWRVVKPGGRLVIFDKFLGEGLQPSRLRALVGVVARALGTDPNRHLSEIIGPMARHVALDEPSVLGGQYRIVLLRKPA